MRPFVRRAQNGTHTMHAPEVMQAEDSRVHVHMVHECMESPVVYARDHGHASAHASACESDREARKEREMDAETARAYA